MGNNNVLLMAININVSGLDDIKKMLKKANTTLETELSNEIASSSNTIRTNAIRNAPYNFSRLRNSIESNKITDLTYEVAAKANYAAYVEFGTGGLVDVPAGYEDFAILFKGKGIKQVNLRPQPFLIPSFEIEKPKLIQRIKKLLNA